MLKWLRKAGSPHQTAIAMVGAKAGDRVLVVGGRAPDFAAELAAVTGLNGQTTVVDADPATEQVVGAAAGRAGTLVEYARGTATSLPATDESQDVAVFMTPLAPLDDAARGAAITEVVRVLRSGGRAVIIDGTRRAGLFSGGSAEARRLESDAVLALLRHSGARASRLLADTDGVAYYEARK